MQVTKDHLEWRIAQAKERVAHVHKSANNDKTPSGQKYISHILDNTETAIEIYELALKQLSAKQTQFMEVPRQSGKSCADYVARIAELEKELAIKRLSANEPAR
jgi:hypothetical protein